MGERNRGGLGSMPTRGRDLPDDCKVDAVIFAADQQSSFLCLSSAIIAEAIALPPQQSTLKQCHGLSSPILTLPWYAHYLQLYVGSLPPSFTDDQLKALFEPFGNVSYAGVVTDQSTVRVHA